MHPRLPSGPSLVWRRARARSMPTQMWLRWTGTRRSVRKCHQLMGDRKELWIQAFDATPEALVREKECC